MKKVFLDELPRKGSYERIDWKKSIGYKVKFIYDDIEGYVTIKNRIDGTDKIIITYKDEDFETYTYSLVKCQISRILKKRTSEFKVNIGDKIINEHSNLIILDRKYKIDNNGHNRKYYTYKCNTCGYIGEIIEYSLLKGAGCSCCSNKVIVEGINDIPTTAPWMVKYFQGGYEEAKQYTRSSGKKIYPICPDCGKIRQSPIVIDDIYRNKSIGCDCKDGISIPEKFMINLLNELNVEYIYQLSRSNLSWCNNYRYDFYIPKFNTIIETHGKQHYINTCFARTPEEEQENDKNKMMLAINNVDEYIVINCKSIKLEWLKNNILNSKLSILFDMSNIDWKHIYELSFKNIVKEVCEFYEHNENYTVKKISQIYKLDKATIYNYIKIGKELGWCSNTKNRKKNHYTRPVLCIELNKEFPSIKECAIELTKLTGKEFNATSIGNVARGRVKTHLGFTFKFINKKE